MAKAVTWAKGSAVGERDGRTVYSFVATGRGWSTGVYACDLAEAKRKLEERSTPDGQS